MLLQRAKTMKGATRNWGML